MVLGFPSNDFGNQEPGSNEQIAEFCRTQYGVRFPMFAKIKVRGDGKIPFYRSLIAGSASPDREIGWNFEKFLVDRQGQVVARFSTATPPQSAGVIEAIERALAAK